MVAPSKVYCISKLRKRKANSFSSNDATYNLVPINKNIHNINPFVGYMNKQTNALNKTVQFRFEIFTNSKSFNKSLTINGISINK